MPKKELVDSCYWIGLFYPRDNHHFEARKIEPFLSQHTMLIPWPTMFEFVDTRLSRRREDSLRFRRFAEGPNALLIDDAPYRAGAFQGVFGNPHGRYSLTDYMLRSMIEDVNLSIDALVTWNKSDFADVCSRHKVELLPHD